MKNNKILLIIIIIVAFLLIGTGGFLLLQTNENESDKNKTEEVKETRNYQTITTVEESTITSSTPTEESFGKEVQEVGFEKTTCENNSCTATNQGYSNTEYEDAVALANDENNDKTFSTILYFHKNDFTVDNVYSKLNAVTNNFFGTKTTKEQIEEIMNGLNSSTDDYYQITYIVGNYTIEINMQNVVGTDFKLVKYLVLSTNLYNQYHGQ